MMPVRDELFQLRRLLPRNDAPGETVPSVVTHNIGWRLEPTRYTTRCDNRTDCARDQLLSLQ